MPFRSLSALARFMYAGALCPSIPVAKKLMTVLWVSVVSLTASTALAQSMSLEQLYRQAVNQPAGPPRIAALENVLQRANGDPIRLDALEVLVWEYAHSNSQQAGQAARELQSVDEANPLALAVLKSGAGITQSKSSSGQREQAEKLATALRSVERMHRPQDMPEPEYAQLQRWTYALLSGSAGMSYFGAKDFESARTYLQRALSVMPKNGTWAYALAMVDLEKDGQSQAAFQELALAVVLAQRTAEASRISDYALRRYQAAGGTATDWNRYLDVARTALNSPKFRSDLPHIALVNFDVPPLTGSKPTSKREQTRSAGTTSAARGKRPGKMAEGERKLEEAISREPADTKAARVPQIEPRHLTPFPPGEPVSLGILLEASIKQEDRREIVQGLSDVVRRLRQNDEAFVIAFGNQLAFEQDLTQNYRLLERAVDEVKPDFGNALYDAVAFAAGHLKRIAKNRNQVLLVISDGQNRGSRESSPQLASEINNVRIYCIGVGSGAQNNYALESLANYTGGRVAFVTAPNQFEPALQSLAQVIYGPYATQETRK